MKKRCLICLALALALCLSAATALAENLTIMQIQREDEESPYPYAEFTAVLGDTAYILMRAGYSAKIMRWQEGMKDAELWADGLFYNNDFDSMDKAKEYLEDFYEQEADPEHMINCFFSDGERLMGVNFLNGKVFAITSADGKAAYEDVATMENTKFLIHQGDGYSYLISPRETVCTGDHLLIWTQDWDDQSGEEVGGIYAVDLKTGAMKTASIKDEVVSLTGYKDGKAVMITRGEDDYDEDKRAYRPAPVLAYDPASDKTEKLGEWTENEYSPRNLLYDAKLDAFLYCSGTRLKSLSTDMKTQKQVGYITNDSIVSMAPVGDRLITLSGYSLNDESFGGVSIYTIDPNFDPDQFLVIYGEGGLNDGAAAFVKAYPQVPVYFTQQSIDNKDPNALWLLMQSGGEDMPDVLEISVGYSCFFTMVAKGACVDLSAYPELKAYADRLYPVYRDALSGASGEVWALPMMADSYGGVSVSKKVMEDMGLTVEDIPTNLVDLCAFINRWNDEFAEEYTKYNVMSYVSNYRQSMFNLMFEGYVEHCAASGTELTFDTPLFRELMDALASLRVDELERAVKVTEAEQSDYKMGLFSMDDYVVGNWTDFSAEDSDRIVIPMSLTKDTPRVESVQVRVLFINPKSAHKDYAAKYIQYQMEDIYSTYAYALFSDLTEPVEHRFYQDNVESGKEWVAEMEQALADAAEEDKADAQANLEAAKQSLAYTMADRWQISPGAIEHYREDVLPTVYVTRPSVFDNGDDMAKEFTTLIDQFQARMKDGKSGIDLEQFIRKMDEKLRMVQMGG